MSVSRPCGQAPIHVCGTSMRLGPYICLWHIHAARQQHVCGTSVRLGPYTCLWHVHMARPLYMSVAHPCGQALTHVCVMSMRPGLYVCVACSCGPQHVCGTSMRPGPYTCLWHVHATRPLYMSVHVHATRPVDHINRSATIIPFLLIFQLSMISRSHNFCFVFV